MSETKVQEVDEPAADAVIDEDPEAVEAIEAHKAFEGDEAEKGNRKHGRSFIYLSLEDAESAARKIDEHEQRMTQKSFAQALGHPKPIGRFKQKLAALESYDLVKTEGDDVRLTDLAVEMLYGGNEQVRTRAKAKAFLSYDLFKKTFVECPKNQDHRMSYVDDFVRVTLKIVNERDMFLKRFLESAKYAGLLEGEPDSKAEAIRLRPALAAPGNGESAVDAKSKTTDDQWVIVAPNEVSSLLDGLGLTGYQDRCDVSQRSAGEIAINMVDGKITVEVKRPVRVAIKTTNMLADVTEILKALQSKGFKA
ncbi:MAG: hypothetical protein AB7O59_11175 [Pirellulales bacterium]